MKNSIHLQANRRHFFGQSATGIGKLALASLLQPKLGLAGEATSLEHVQVAPKAKRVISLFMSGGPSHIDLFDPKPLLTTRHGEPIPESIVRDHHFAMIKEANPKVHGTPWKFSRHGRSGATVSELLPCTSKVVDEICFVHSVYSETFNHGPAVSFMTTGDANYGRPTLGSWLSYGLGSENENLPAFVVLQSGQKLQPLLSSYWGSGFLPSQHQGVQFRSQGDPVLFLSNPKGVTRSARREQLDLLANMNQQLHAEYGDPEINTRIASFELAYRMQTNVPLLMNISQEPESMHRMYGSQPGNRSFANNCLLARRLAERGVRFIQLFDMGWDQHGDLVGGHTRQCAGIDQAVAALLSDLRQRGMLDETLVIWGGEFGRTPMAQGNGAKAGRDHHPHGFSMWMAGGGIKPGMTYGATDAFGYRAVENPVSLYDLNATILHCLGIDHRALTYRFQGRDFRLTDVHGEVIAPILA